VDPKFLIKTNKRRKHWYIHLYTYT